MVEAVATPDLNLMVHAGGWHASRDEVAEVLTPAPHKRHYPIPHGEFLDTVQRVIEQAGMTITAESYALSHEGMRMFGMMALGFLDNRFAMEGKDYSTIIGLRGAHDQSMTRSLAFGNNIFVCDNLAFIGEEVLSRKHTRFAREDLPRLITTGISRVNEMREAQAVRIDRYQETELIDSQVNDLLIASLDAQVISSSKIGQVLAEYREPRHQEFREGGMTAWRLFNAYTEILKDSNLFERPRRTQALYGLMDMTVGVN